MKCSLKKKTEKTKNMLSFAMYGFNIAGILTVSEWTMYACEYMGVMSDV